MTTMDNNMISISPQAAREIFITSGCGLICQHESGLFAGDPEGNAYISSGCVVIHSPICVSMAASSSGMVPSARGPMLSSRQPFLLTMSTRSRTRSAASRYSLPSVWHQEFSATAVSVCQA